MGEALDAAFELVIGEGFAEVRAGNGECAGVVAAIIVEMHRRTVRKDVVRHVFRRLQLELLAHGGGEFVARRAAVHEAKRETFESVLIAKEPDESFAPEGFNRMVYVEAGFVAATAFPRLPCVATHTQAGRRAVRVVAPLDAQESYGRIQVAPPPRAYLSVLRNVGPYLPV